MALPPTRHTGFIPSYDEGRQRGSARDRSGRAQLHYECLCDSRAAGCTLERARRSRELGRGRHTRDIDASLGAKGNAARRVAARAAEKDDVQDASTSGIEFYDKSIERAPGRPDSATSREVPRIGVASQEDITRRVDCNGIDPIDLTATYGGAEE